MPYGYIDPVQRAREQQALRQMAQPRQRPAPWQQPAPWQAACPAEYQSPAGPQIGQWNDLQPHQQKQAGELGRIVTLAIGAAIGYLIYRN